MTDYEISKTKKLLPITEVAKKLRLKEENILPYGKYMAKIDNINVNSTKGKLILVTSTNPTPYGEGKTTLAIGLTDALNKNGYNSCVVLREPSLGPVFGNKGGATGGGMSQVAPMNNINLHFTGDFHAITSANNLISAMIDNHIFQGNKLGIKNVYFTRCMDINDRSLRNISTNLRNDHFTITAASEIMAIFTLAQDINDLKEKLNNILIGKSFDNKDIFLKDIGGVGAVLALLKDALKPNLVQTLENNPAIIHGGPFANIAHGCNSIIATKLGLALSDYVITEAGFGSDMGALKFLDIKCKLNNLYPDLIVLNATIRSLKHHGEGDINKGIGNLEYHIKNMQKFTDNLLVILNKFADDTDEEIKLIKKLCKSLNTEMLISNMYKNGSKNTKKIAETIVKYSNRENKKRYNIYEDDDDIITKVEKYCKNMFGAKEIIYNDNIKEELKNLNSKYKNFRICISKTPSSITDNPKVLGYPKDFTMTVTGYKINNGSGFITILMGNVLTMPGLVQNANYYNIDVINDEIIGIF
ncbi:MAG: formate--tetrahydrofolate ligase [Bacilli bacterium]|nr:formate--tetrahydrofolate ligase [Bacilli bacterium]